MALQPGVTAAYLFPGQGSQHVGMGLDLYKKSPAARGVFAQVDHTLGMPFSRLLFEGNAKELEKTVNSQPAIMTVSLACLRAMEERLGPDQTPRPTLMAGHSLGEYTALVAAGVLDLASAISLVRLRGSLMQQASERTPGGMVAIIGLDEATVEEICRQAGAEIANVNSHTQIVISGTSQALDRAIKLAEERGTRRTVPLPVSGAFHSSLMKYAMEALALALDSLQLKDPDTPIVANCTGESITSSHQMKEELKHQLCRCVQWEKTVDCMVKRGVSNFIEIGPGRVLSGLVKSMHRNARVSSVQDLASIEALVS